MLLLFLEKLQPQSSVVCRRRCIHTPHGATGSPPSPTSQSTPCCPAALAVPPRWTCPGTKQVIWGAAAYVFQCPGAAVSLILYTALPAGDGDLRLAGGPNSTAGRLEVYHSGRWGTICDRYFDSVSAGVACRQMGFKSPGIVKGGGYYGSGSSSYPWLKDIRCKGSEATLTQCTNRGYWDSSSCSYGSAVDIECPSGATGREASTDMCNSLIDNSESAEVHRPLTPIPAVQAPALSGPASQT